MNALLRRLLRWFLPAAFAVSSLHAVVVFEDNFNRETLANNYTGAGDVWSTAGSSFGSVAVNAGKMNVTRSAASGSGDFVVISRLDRMNSFNTATVSQAQLTLKFDLQVNAFLATDNGANAIRIGLYQSSTTNRIFLAYGAVEVNGTVVNAFYVTTTLTGAATAGQVVGYDSSTQTWADGFNFGAYDTTTATANATGTVSVAISYLNQANTALFTLTTSDGQSASITLTGLAASTWSNSTTSGGIRVYAPNAGDVDFTVDNIELTAAAIPEPGTVAIILGGSGLVLAACRRRVRR